MGLEDKSKNMEVNPPTALTETQAGQVEAHDARGSGTTMNQQPLNNGAAA